jgi:hypothetical protein
LEVVGTPSCSARSCHGGIDPLPGRIAQNEYSVWIRKDKHANAYDVLFGERSQQIMVNLSGGPAHQDSRCLACHTVPASGGKEDLAWLRPDGVGCESCHGPAKQWRDRHYSNRITFWPWTSNSWRDLSPESKKKYGFTPVNDLSDGVRASEVARACIGCHIGAPPDAARSIPRDVNHDLLAAGHPRLTFELATFLANLPPHWNSTVKEDRRARSYEARLWAVGQLEAARAALELLAYRAGQQQGEERRWPEFAEYDCFACHHDLSQPSWRQIRKPLKPVGSQSWGSWYYTMLRPLSEVILGQSTDYKRLGEALDQLEQVMNGPAPERKKIVQILETLKAPLSKLQQSVEIQDYKEDLVDRLLTAIHRESPRLVSRSWDSAEQCHLAIAALKIAQTRQRPSESTRAALRALGEKLAIPSGYKSPQDFWGGDQADPELKKLLDQLCR